VKILEAQRPGRNVVSGQELFAGARFRRGQVL